MISILFTVLLMGLSWDFARGLQKLDRKARGRPLHGVGDEGLAIKGSGPPQRRNEDALSETVHQLEYLLAQRSKGTCPNLSLDRLQP